MVHVIYRVGKNWYTYPPTVMSQKGADRVCKILQSQGYETKQVTS